MEERKKYNAARSAGILTRMGNKRRIAHAIVPHFPAHRVYIDPFFGAGGMFFSKPKAEQNLLSDLDGEVFNLWQVVVDRGEELAELWGRMPIDQKLFMYWKRHRETDPVRRALRFLTLSNFSLLGKGGTPRVFTGSTKRLVLQRIHAAQRELADCEFRSEDFRTVLGYVAKRAPKDTFIYADPPYLGTSNNYEAGKFTERDSEALFDSLEATGRRFAMSEFDHPFILEQAHKRKLRVEVIGERHNLANRRTEVLILNYPAREAA